MVQVTAELAEPCGALELSCFPNANPEELISADDVRAYARVFPEGFFVVLDEDTVVGQGAGILVDFDFDRPQHRIVELCGPHQCLNHRAEAGWYYGTDIVVHPGWRRRGIGQMLYDLRKDLVMRLGKRGILAGSHLANFKAHKSAMSAPAYIDAVVRGELYDATLSFQMQMGFRVIGALENYLEDPDTDSWAAFIRWDNPGFRDPGSPA